MKKHIKTLAKELDFTRPVEYYDYLHLCHENGNISQCRELFAAMRKDNQKEFFKVHK